MIWQLIKLLLALLILVIQYLELFLGPSAAAPLLHGYPGLRR